MRHSKNQLTNGMFFQIRFHIELSYVKQIRNTLNNIDVCINFIAFIFALLSVSTPVNMLELDVLNVAI